VSSWLTHPAPFELGTDGPRAIVVGIEDSPTSLRALDYAAGLARRQGARLVAVHVRPLRTMQCAIDPCGYRCSGDAARAALDAQDALEAELRADVDRLPRLWGVGIDLVVRDGDPLRELTAVAADQHADSLVVGASTRPGSRVAGSVAARLVRRRRWPVTVVP
jgi:nucleotide-binding universal stress UspA family protein